MKTIYYVLVLFFMVGTIACNDSKVEVRTPSNDAGAFHLSAKESQGQYLEVTIINTQPDAKGFAYADCTQTQGFSVLPEQLRFCFQDTSTIKLLIGHTLKLYQIKERKDGTGLALQDQQSIYLQVFFGIH